MLVYPGGDYEVHRPIWERHRVDFDGRKGFIKLALDQDVPIVPVVSIGGQETSIFLSRGEGLAKLLRLDKAFRLKVLPISLALPWGVNVGDMLGHWPLPAKIVVEALPPIDLREEFGDEPDLDEVYDHIIRQMQDTLDALASERRLPADRMRVNADIAIGAPPELVWATVCDPARALHYMSRHHALGGRGRPARRPRRPLPDAHARRLGRDRRARRGRGVGRASATSPGRRSPASTSAAAGACATRATARTHVEFRLAYGVAGAGVFGWLAEQLAAPHGPRPPAAHAAAAQAPGRARAAARRRARRRAARAA